MEHPSAHHNAVVAVFTRHQDAEEKVVGFYNMGDRIKFWGKNGAFWGGLWSLFFGGIFLTIPMVGSVMVPGHLAAMVVAAVEGAILFGGLSALGAALFSIGIPKDSVIEYEQAVKTDGFLVVAHGSAEEMTKSKAILEASNPSRVDLHENVKTPASDEVQAAGKTDEVLRTR